MQKIAISLFLTIVIALSACKDTKDTNSTTIEMDNTTPDSVIVEKKPEIVKIYAWVDKLRLREKPNTKSAIVKELHEGEELIFTGKKSDFTQKINLRGTVYDEPWLEVNTSEGKTGWAFGGGIKFYKPSVDTKPTAYEACFALLYKNRTEQYQKCVAKIQERQLKKDKTFVRVTSEGHEIKLLDGTVHKLLQQSPTETDSTFVHYSYRNYIAEMGFYVFQKESSPDGIAYTLVNDKSAKLTDILAYPKPSPDGKHVLCLYTGKENEEVIGFEIFGFTVNGFKGIFSEQIENYFPTKPKWIDEEKLELTLEPIDNDGFYTPKTVQYKYEHGEWKKA